MSRVLARTSMISDDRMLNAATRMMMHSTTNIAIRSTSSASNSAEFICRQSTMMPLALRPAAASGARISPTLSGSSTCDLDHADLVAEHQQGLRVLHRHDDERLVIFVDADLEDRADGVGDDARHGADRRSSGLRG